jgi:MFS family permease
MGEGLPARQNVQGDPEDAGTHPSRRVRVPGGSAGRGPPRVQEGDGHRLSHRWAVVGCAFLLAVWGWGLGFYALGVYLVALQQAHGWSASAVSGAITTYYLVGAGLIALLGRAIARFGPVPTILGGITAMALSVVSLTVIAEIWQLYLAFVAMAIGWSTMSSAVINILVAPWFDRQQGLALSLAFTGASIGGVIVGPAVLWLVATLGFTTGVRVAVIAMLVILVPVVVVVLGRRASPAPSAAGAVAENGDSGATSGPRPLRSLSYWTISVPFAAGLVAQVGFITHQVAFLTPFLGSARTALCVSLMAIAATLARLALGGVIDRMDARVAASGNFLVQVVGLALLIWRPSHAALYVGCVVVGLAVGNMVSLPGLLVSRQFSRAQFAGVVSLVTATNQVTFAFAPTLMGVLRDATGDYTAALALCLALDFTAAVIVLAGRSAK